MKPMQLGKVQVQAVVEATLPLSPSDLLPQSTPERLAAHKGWLVPNFMDPAGMLTISIHTYVVRTSKHTILVDTCFGNDKKRDIPPANMRTGTYLKDLGVAPEEVDYVLCTHMHMDHVGWNTSLKGGRWTPTFPRAKYLFAAQEWAHWKSVKEGEFGCDAVKDSVMPVIESGQAVLIDGGYPLNEEAWIENFPGHTPGHVCLHLASQGKRGILTGDLMHHPVQCAEPDWNSAFCVHRDQALLARKVFLNRYADTDVVVLAAHFNAPTSGRIISHGNSWRFQPLDR